jgi:hypothetical protein
VILFSKQSSLERTEFKKKQKTTGELSGEDNFQSETYKHRIKNLFLPDKGYGMSCLFN